MTRPGRARCPVCLIPGAMLIASGVGGPLLICREGCTRADVAAHLESQGWDVLRLTGSEIVRDPPPLSELISATERKERRRQAARRRMTPEQRARYDFYRVTGRFMTRRLGASAATKPLRLGVTRSLVWVFTVVRRAPGVRLNGQRSERDNRAFSAWERRRRKGGTMSFGRWLMTAVAAVAVLGVPAPAEAQAPTQDVVQADGDAGPIPGGGGFFDLDFSLRSGPNGESPSGHAGFRLGAPAPAGLLVEGPVLCMQVSGNTAHVAIDSAEFPGSPVVAKLVDGGAAGSGLDRFDAFLSNGTDTNCGFRSFNEQPVVGGDVIVVDAPRLPTTKGQCRDGGWRLFSTFKSQGDCVSYVATPWNNRPAKSTSR